MTERHGWRRALRATAVVVSAATIGYGAVQITAAPAAAAPPAPATSNPNTISAEVKTCPPGPSGVAICLGPSGEILQSKIPIDPADHAGVQALLTDARNLVIGIHGWEPTDRRINGHGQSEIWGAMYALLHGIIRKPANQRTPNEQGAYHWFQQVVQQYRVKSAQNALNEYKNWQSQQCGYKPGAPTPSYDPGIGCGQTFGGLVTGAKHPTFEQLQSWGAYQAVQQLGTTSNSAEAVGIGLAGGLTTGAIALGTAGGITIGATASATTISSIAGSAAAYSSTSATIGTSLAGAAAGTIAIGLFAAVVFILAIVVLIVAIVQQAGYAELPKKLQGALDSAQGSLPDLSSMVDDTTTGGANLLASLFMAQTEIRSMATVLPSGAAVSTIANWHGDTLKTQSAEGGVPTGPTVTSKALSVRSWGDPWDAITKATPPGGSTPPVLWLTDQGWFQQSIDGGATWTTRSSLRYLDWQGNERTALIQGNKFIDVPSEGGVTGASPANLCNATGKCSLTSTLRMLDANGTPVEVTTTPAIPVPATIDVVSGGSPFTEGETTVFKDPEVDSRGGAVTYKWEFESRCVGLCFGGLDPAFKGNPVVTLFGQTVSYTWPTAGTFHMRLTTTNDGGTRVTDQDVTVVKGAAPSVTVEDDESKLGPIFSGGSVRLAGCIDVAGGRFVRPKLTIDWGDGTTDQAQPAQITIIVDGVPQNSGPIVIQDGGANGCSTPWSYVANHVYEGDPDDAFSIDIGLDDTEGGSAEILDAATVEIYPADLLPTSFGFTNATRGYVSDVYGSIPEFSEGELAHLELEFNAPPNAYGNGINIDWDQFGIRTAFFSSCDAGGCTLQSSYEDDNRFWSKPGSTDRTIYNVRALVIDEDTSEIQRQIDIPVAIENVPPELSDVIVMPGSEPQGGEVTLTGKLTSVDPHTPFGLRVTWPDGTKDELNLPRSTSQTFSVKHVLREVGTFPVKVEVTDDAGGTDEAIPLVNVSNVGPAPSVAPMAVDVGEPVSLTVLTGDPGWLDTFSQAIGWGDNTPMEITEDLTTTEGTLATQPHVYKRPGVYTVLVGLLDQYGAQAFTETTVTVNNVRPVVTVDSGASADLTAEVTGSFVDPGLDESFTGTIDWRDGTAPEPFVVTAGARDFALSHTYAHGGVYPVHVTISDDQGGVSDVATGVLSVDGPPAFTANDPDDGVLGEPVAYQISARGFPLPTFEVTDGALPPGVTLGLDGYLGGAPTALGEFTFEVTASNTFGEDVSAPITVVVRSRPSFTADTPPEDALVGELYAYTFAVDGVPTPTFDVGSGTLPPGLDLDPDTGELAGTPTTVGSYTFQVGATNVVGTTLSASHTIVVRKALTVTGPTASREYGAPNPALTPSYDGFLPDEDETDLATAPTCTTAAGPTSSPGDHAVTCAGGVSPSYAFTYVPGTLTVTKAATSTSVAQSGSSAYGGAITLTARISGGSAPTGTVQFRTPVGNIGPPVAVSGGQAALTTTGVLTGLDVVTATYSGDSFHAGSSGQRKPTVTFSQTVTGQRKGNLAMNGGTWLVHAATVTGAVTVGAGTKVVVRNSTVNSSFTATDPGSVQICGSTLKNALTINRAAGFVLVGDASNDGCAPNSVNGGVTITLGGGGLNLRGNDLRGGARVDGNLGGGPFAVDVAPVIAANVIRGQLACTGNTPAPTNLGAPNTASKRLGQCAAL